MSTLILPPIMPSVFDIWGPITIGVLLSVFGMGILLMQTINYFDSSPSDSSYLMSVILLILGLNVGQTLSDCSRLMKLDVWYAGDWTYLFDIRARPEELISPSFSLVICTIAQLFLLRRCIIFGRISAPFIRGDQEGWRRYVRIGWRVVLFLGIIMSLICGIVTIVGLGQLHSLIEANRRTYPNTLLARWSTAFISCQTATDLSLSATLLWELRAARNNQDTSRKGKRAIRAIIRIAWSNGILVGILQLVSLFFLIFETSSWVDFAQIFISKAYSITLLASITSPISALRGHSHAHAHAHAPALRPARPPALHHNLDRPITPTTTPLPMLFINKNPSAEWSPYSASGSAKDLHLPATFTAYPLRNADTVSAEHVRGAGRARLHSMASSAAAGWGNLDNREAAPSAGVELDVDSCSDRGETRASREVYSNRSSGVLGVEMDYGHSPDSIRIPIEFQQTPRTSTYPNVSIPNPNCNHNPAIAAVASRARPRWREHVMPAAADGDSEGEEEGGGRIKRGRTLMGRPRRVERDDNLVQGGAEEVSMDAKIEGGGRTFGSVGGVSGIRSFELSVGEAV